MPVIKSDLHRIVPDRIDGRDTDGRLPGLQCFLPRSVAADLGRGREDTQEFRAELEIGAITEAQLESTS